jgi:hypothetical protein
MSAWRLARARQSRADVASTDEHLSDGVLSFRVRSFSSPVGGEMSNANGRFLSSVFRVSRDVSWAHHFCALPLALRRLPNHLFRAWCGLSSYH